MRRAEIQYVQLTLWFENTEHFSDPTLGVKYSGIDFSAVASGFGVWSRRVETMASLEEAVREGLRIDGPVVIDAVVDPAEYVAHHPRQRTKAAFDNTSTSQ